MSPSMSPSMSSAPRSMAVGRRRRFDGARTLAHRRRLRVGAGAEAQRVGGWDRGAYGRGYADVPEADAPFDVVVRADGMPPGVKGTYFRNGPGLFTRGGSTVNHPFDGDGFVTRLAIPGDGTVRVRGDFVGTEAYRAEKKANKRLFRNSFGTQRDGGPLNNAFDVSQKNIANTNVLVWPPPGAGATPRLLALWEAAQPHRLDPTSLATVGVDYLDGLLRPGAPFGTGVEAVDAFLSANDANVGGRVLAAHPHVDPRDGRLVCCGTLVGPNLEAEGGLGTTVTFYELDDELKPLETSHVRIPGFVLLHDFSFTENYYIVVSAPLQLNSLPFLLGFKGPGEPDCINFDAEAPSKIHLIPRPQAARRGAKKATLDIPSAFVFHHVNAYDTSDGNVVLDVVQTRGFSAWHPDRELEARFGGFHKGLASGDPAFLDTFFDADDTGKLVRYTIDVAARTAAASAPLSERTVEFPRLNDACWSRQHRFAYCGGSRDPVRSQPLQAWVKFDFETMTEEVLYDAGACSFVGEPTFVPREGAEAEDDGYVLGLVYNGKSGLTDFVVVDARDATKCSVVTIPVALPLPALHGCWDARVFV